MLQFKPITIDTLQEIKPFLDKQTFRTCDFTIGGIYMWIDYFNYEYCITDNLLFIKGFAENEVNKISFSIPIGDNSLSHGINLLTEYCHSHSLPLLLSAVPEDGKIELEKLYSCHSVALQDWSDYFYDREELSALPGRKFNKKRNRVNKFCNTYPNIAYQPITTENLNAVKLFFHDFSKDNQKNNPYFAFEKFMVTRVLDYFFALNFIGGILTIDKDIAAFSIGEVVNDTLFVHVEKANKNYAGIYEMINYQFARNACNNPDVIYINREEDVGDEGIRRAKNSYNPIKLLTKYNINIE